MNKLFGGILIVLFFCLPASAAQQYWIDGALFSEVRVVIEANFEELYAEDNLSKLTGCAEGSFPYYISGDWVCSNLDTIIAANNAVQANTAKVSYPGDELSVDQQAAIDNATLPSAANPFVTESQIPAGGTDDQTAAEVPFTPDGSISATDVQAAIVEVRDEAGSATTEGTAVLSTGETGGTKYLREDGDGTSSWQTIAGGGDALVANPLSQFAATTSAQFMGVISDETGSGSVVGSASPTFTGTVGAAAITATGTITSASYASSAADGSRYQTLPDNTVEPTAASVNEGTYSFGNELYVVEGGVKGGTILDSGDVDDVPVNGATTVPVSSNRMFDHEAASNPHGVTAAGIGAATTAQGALADSATQPGDLATVATTGAYGDLTSTPTIPTATSALTNDSRFVDSAQASTIYVLDDCTTATGMTTGDLCFEY